MSGEARLVEEVVAAMEPGPTRILNIGAGHSPWIERQIELHRSDFVSDRIDIELPVVSDQHAGFAHVGHCWQAPVEDMHQIPSGSYSVAFANYVLEHVRSLDAAAREVRRVLRPGGVFVMTGPNPSAPHLQIARVTPLWFHRLVRRSESWPTVYAFRSPEELGVIFERHGFRCRRVHRSANISGYLQQWPHAIYRVGRAFDDFVTRRNLRWLMGDACVVCEAVD